MPVFSFGERKNGWLKSSGLSWSQTLSSFCQKASTPSLRFASLMTSANGRKPPLAATIGGAPGGRRPEAAPPGPIDPVGADAPGAGAAAPVTNVWKVVQPVSTTLAATTKPRARPGVRLNVGMREVLGKASGKRIRW